MENKGLIHIYCGDGKGKTTAVTGLAIRCAGGNGKVLFCQFLKDGKSGEIEILQQLDNIEVFNGCKTDKFSFQMTEEEKKVICKKYCADLKCIEEKINTQLYDLLVLDEVIYAINSGFVKIDDVIKLLNKKPYNLEVVLTGRNPDEKLYEMADYISEIKKIKHPFDKGIGARKLIER